MKYLHCFSFSMFSSFSELFDNYMQQDAHEFLNYLLNTIADLLQEEKKQEKQNGKLQNGSIESEEGDKTDLTWVHEIFQGTLTNETRCLNCEAVRLKQNKISYIFHKFWIIFPNTKHAFSFIRIDEIALSLLKYGT